MPGENIDSRAQSAVVLEVLERPDGVPMTEVFATIRDVDTARIMAAADSLQEVGLIRRDGDRIYSTPALDRLDAIGMVTI
jgi:hypothetical protein